MPPNLRHCPAQPCRIPRQSAQILRNACTPLKRPSCAGRPPLSRTQRLGPPHGQSSARHTFAGMVGGVEDVWSAVAARREAGLTSPAVRLAACALFEENPWLWRLSWVSERPLAPPQYRQQLHRRRPVAFPARLLSLGLQRLPGLLSPAMYPPSAPACVSAGRSAGAALSRICGAAAEPGSRPAVGAGCRRGVCAP